MSDLAGIPRDEPVAPYQPDTSWRSCFGAAGLFVLGAASLIVGILL